MQWIDYIDYSPRQMIQLSEDKSGGYFTLKLNVEGIHLIDVLSQLSVIETLKEKAQRKFPDLKLVCYYRYLRLRPKSRKQAESRK